MSPLRRLPDQRQGTAVGGSRFVEPAKALTQVGARGMGQVVVAQFATLKQCIDQIESGLGAVTHRHRDGAVELDHR